MSAISENLMITLGIIGVVAALTIPGLITMQQKHAAVTGIIAAQSILSQAVKMYTADTDEEGSISFDTTLPVQDFAEKYFLPYLKVAQVCTKMSDGCWQSGDFYGYYDLAGKKMTNTVPYSIVLNNGMVFGFNKVDDGPYSIVSVIVDVNGKSSRNVMGKDVFSFYLFNNSYSINNPTFNGKPPTVANGIYPGGFGDGGLPHVIYSRSDLLSNKVARACNKQATNWAYNGNRPGVGTACAAVIFKDGWKIRPDYPWN